MADDLASWARRRAPELLARAEAEAVAALLDALVDAALAGRGTEAPAPRQAEPRATVNPARVDAPAGDGLWAYCVTHDGETAAAGVAGVDGGVVEQVKARGLAALVSRVRLAEFGAGPLRENLNDLDWLERVARAHEAVLDRALADSTIVPLRLCTIYESEDSVREMLEREHDSLGRALDTLAGRQEWGVKLLAQEERLAEEARSRSLR